MSSDLNLFTTLSHRFFVIFLFLMCAGFYGQAQMRPFYVRTTGNYPFLNYGLGSDRLGGAKMTYLDSNVLLKVVDTKGSYYRVQLSKYHEAWVQRNNVKSTAGYNVPEYLIESWTVAGDSLYDYVTISTPEKLPYTSRMTKNPSEIEVDVFGAVSNVNWINQQGTAEEVKDVWYDQIEDDVMRVHIALNHSTQWGYHIYYDTLQRLTIRVKRQPKHLTLQGITIAVDAGHGGSNSGARGVKSRLLEKNLTLIYANDLYAALKKRGARVVMTRTTDATMSMEDRLNFLNAVDPTLLVSIHFNSSARDTVHGVSTYYRYPGFRPLSQHILKQMLKTGLSEFGNIGSFNFALNGPTEFPNALVEVAFLSNEDDEAKVRTSDFAKEVAERIADGIEDFLRSAGGGNSEI